MAILKDFYCGEIRKKANIVHLKLHQYNTIRDENLAICAKNPKVYTEEYVQNIFRTTREEMFEMIKRNEALFVRGKRSKIWNILSLKDYKEWIDLKYTDEFFRLICFLNNCL